MTIVESDWMDWGDESSPFGSLQARRGCKRDVTAVVALHVAWLLLESVGCICRGDAQHQQHIVRRIPQGSSMPHPNN